MGVSVGVFEWVLSGNPQKGYVFCCNNLYSCLLLLFVCLFVCMFVCLVVVLLLLLFLFFFFFFFFFFYLVKFSPRWYLCARKNPICAPPSLRAIMSITIN